jgi:WD40 repeat protein
MDERSEPIAEAPAIAPASPPTASFQGLATHAVHEEATLAPGDGATVALASSAPPPAASDPARVRYFGDYEIERELARGGMGVVFRARQISLNRPVALKMILAGQLADETEVRRFYTEAEAAANLDHPGIVPIYEVGQHEGQHYFSMALVDGESLAQRLSAGPLPPREAAELTGKVAETIEYAHSRGVIHRDLKPGNILLDRKGNPRVTDFGLAKKVEGDSGLTGSGQIMGTPSYMPPEQVGGKRGLVGPVADVYSLGATLYALLTGRPPFHAATAMDTVLQVISDEPVSPRRLNASIPLDLETICLKCLEKEPGKRYTSAAALADDLRRFLKNQPIEARRSSAIERAGRWCWRNPAVAALCGITSTLLFTLTAVSVTATILINGARNRADQKAAGERAAREAADAAAGAEKLARRHAQERLVRLNLVTGNFQTDADDLGAALLRYSQAWTLDPDDSAEAIHRLRMAFVLEHYPRLEGICFHTSPVLEARYDTRRARVLTRTADERAHLWDPFRSVPLASPLPHNARVFGIALCPDGTLAVTTGSDGMARLWDTATGQPLGAALRHPDAVRYAAFSPDGRRLATACADGTVRFWSIPQGKQLEPAIQVGSELSFVGFSPDGRLVATVDGLRMARVWDAEKVQPLTPSLPHRVSPGNPADCLFQPPLFSPEGARILTAGDDSGIRVSDARTGAPAGPPLRVDFGVNHVAISSDGATILVVGQNRTSLLLDATGAGNHRRLAHPREVQAGCLSADGHRVATSSSTGLIHLRDARTLEDLVRPFRHASTVTDLTFTPEGNRLVAVSLDGTVRIWAINLKPFEASPYDYCCGRADRLYVAAHPLSPDGTWRVQANETTGARLVRRKGGEPGPTLSHPGPVRQSLFAPDGRSVLTADDEHAQVWDALAGQARGPLVSVRGGLASAQFSDDASRLMLIDGEGEVSVRETASGRVLVGPITLDAELQTEQSHSIHDVVALGPDGRLLAVHFPSPYPGETRVYKVDSGRMVAIPVPNGYRASVAFSPDGRRLLTAGSDTLARVWDGETAKAVSPPMRHPSFVRLARFAPDGRLVATHDGSDIRLWDSATGDMLRPVLHHHHDGALDIWFSRDGRRLIGFGGDGSVLQWELPMFQTAKDSVIPFVQLLTAEHVDEVDGIAPLEAAALRGSADKYRRAWLSWRGLDYPAAKPSAAERGPETKTDIR